MVRSSFFENFIYRIDKKAVRAAEKKQEKLVLLRMLLFWYVEES